MNKLSCESPKGAIGHPEGSILSPVGFLGYSEHDHLHLITWENAAQWLQISVSLHLDCMVREGQGPCLLFPRYPLPTLNSGRHGLCLPGLCSLVEDRC